MKEHDWNAPLRCPACASEAGHPCRAESHSAERVIVIVRCGQCQNEWKIERATPSTWLPAERKPHPADQ